MNFWSNIAQCFRGKLRFDTDCENSAIVPEPSFDSLGVHCITSKQVFAQKKHDFLQAEVQIVFFHKNSGPFFLNSQLRLRCASAEKALATSGGGGRDQICLSPRVADRRFTTSVTRSPNVYARSTISVLVVKCLSRACIVQLKVTRHEVRPAVVSGGGGECTILGLDAEFLTELVTFFLC